MGTIGGLREETRQTRERPFWACVNIVRFWSLVFKIKCSIIFFYQKPKCLIIELLTLYAHLIETYKEVTNPTHGICFYWSYQNAYPFVVCSFKQVLIMVRILCKLLNL